LLAIGADQLHLAIIVSLAIALVFWKLHLRVLRRADASIAHDDTSYNAGDGWRALARRAVLAAGGVAAIVYYWMKQDSILPIDGDEWIALLATVTVLVIGGLAVVASAENYFASKESRTWAAIYAFVVFMVAVTIGGIGSYAKQLNQPTARGAAVRLSDGSTLSGLYIAETGTSLHIAEIARTSVDATRGVKYEGQIVEIPQGRVREIRVGDYQPLALALNHAVRLTRELG
jgi:hypothetical protein